MYEHSPNDSKEWVTYNLRMDNLHIEAIVKTLRARQPTIVWLVITRCQEQFQLHIQDVSKFAEHGDTGHATGQT